MSYLAIQLIQIVYQDDQRGAETAVKRERLRAMPLPAIAGDGVFHDCRADIWNRYEPRGTVSGVPLRDGVVSIGESLEVRTTGAKLELTSKLEPSKPPLLLADDTWARVVWNRVDGDAETKWLVQLVVNAGRFSGGPPAASVFLGTPAVQRDLRHDFLRNGYAAR